MESRYNYTPEQLETYNQDKGREVAEGSQVYFNTKTMRPAKVAKVTKAAKVSPAPTGHNTIKSLAADILSELQSELLANFDRAFVIGEKLSAIRKACEDPNCGYSGKTTDKRFSAALKAEVLSLADLQDLNVSNPTLFRYRNVYETFGDKREQLRGKASYDALQKLATAKFDGIRDEAVKLLIAGKTAEYIQLIKSVAPTKAKGAASPTDTPIFKPKGKQGVDMRALWEMLSVSLTDQQKLALKEQLERDLLKDAS